MTGIWPAVATGAVITALTACVLLAAAIWWGSSSARHNLRLKQQLRATERDLEFARLEADERLDMLVRPVEQALASDQEQ